jgi:glycosyltransferase involved in cell wall biosynthesis
VFAQDSTDLFEVILVNDGSPDTDELEGAIAPFRKQLIYHTQANSGPSAARNTALRLSQAPFIALLDGDDLYLPNYLRAQSELLRSDSDLILVYGDMEVFGGSVFDGQRLSVINHESEPPSLETLLRGTATVLNTPMIRREVIIAAGGWDETSRHSEDYDLWLRIAASGGKLRRHGELIGRYRVRPDGLSRNEQRIAAGRIYAFTKLLSNVSLQPKLVPLIDDKIKTARADIALLNGKEALREGNVLLAATHIADAAKYKQNLRLGIIARLLRTFPWLVYAVFSLRARFWRRYRSA